MAQGWKVGCAFEKELTVINHAVRYKEKPFKWPPVLILNISVWGPVVQWLVQRFRSERLRVRSRRSATFTPSAHVRRQSLPVWPPTLNNLPFISDQDSDKIASRCGAPGPPMTDVGTETAFRLDQRKHFQKSKHLLRSEVSWCDLHLRRSTCTSE